MKKIVINGKFTSDRMQGIVRYAYEITLAMDALCSDKDITLLVPVNACNIPNLNNIKVVEYGNHLGIKWEQIDLARYLRHNKGSVCLNFCNVAPLFVQSGVTVVHDIMYRVLPENYSTLRNKISRYWHMFQYGHVIRKEQIIVTVSEFSRGEIERNYPKAKGKVVVVPNAWQHVLKYKENLSWQEDYPYLQDKKFYFSLSTLSNHKNGKWIIEVAKNNPDSQFAIGGKYYETEKVDIPSNVHMLGFISDEDACALMKHCKAFIHPSLYEGFGIPPLEALALGAVVISSNTTALPEVLGDSVHYIDPYNYAVNLDILIDMPIADRMETLKRYSWVSSANAMIDVLEKL